jgi:hypothetical protein
MHLIPSHKIVSHPQHTFIFYRPQQLQILLPSTLLPITPTPWISAVTRLVLLVVMAYLVEAMAIL